MSEALATVPNPDEQPKWLVAMPEGIRGGLTDLTLKQQLAASRLDPTSFIGLTAEEAKELIAEAAENMETDEKTTYVPEIIKIIHDSQLFKNADGSIIGSKLEGVIVHHHPTRGCWEENETLPLCGSRDGVIGNARADAGSDFPWAINKHGERLCAECPHDKWGSDPKNTDGRGKRCKEKERLFFLTDDRSLPALLSVPPTSQTEFQTFNSGLRNRKPLTTTRMVRVLIELEKLTKPGQVYSGMKFVSIGKLDSQTFLHISRMSKAIVEAAKKLGLEVTEDKKATANGPAANGPTPSGPGPGGGRGDVIDIKSAPAPAIAADDDDDDVPF